MQERGCTLREHGEAVSHAHQHCNMGEKQWILAYPWKLSSVMSLVERPFPPQRRP